MGSKKNIMLKHLILSFLLIISLFFEVIIHYFTSAIVHTLVINIIKGISFGLWLYLFHIWFMKPHSKFIGNIKKYHSDLGFNLHGEKSIFDYNALDRIISHYKHNKAKQDELMSQLKHKNELLEQNNKITSAIMDITKEILFSGEIDSVLKIILEKAIKIIPNAQKGSILIYNGSYLDFKAVSGYDFDTLKDFKFDITESFQYKTNDFLEPVIIRDVEAFNRNLNQDRFETLKNSRSLELKSSISCAISSDGEFLGIINIDNVDDIDAFNNGDKPIIKHLAEQMGLALKNAKLIEKTVFLSRHDSLTGIYNRCYFEELYSKFYRTAYNSNGLFSVVLFDINDLKKVNDSYGHEAGDKLIIKFVDTISNSDYKPNVFARTGGDEFIAMYLNYSKDKVFEIMEEIKGLFKFSPLLYDEKKILYISFGYGVSSFPADSTCKDDLLRIADKRMYLNKNSYKQKLVD